MKRSLFYLFIYLFALLCFCMTSCSVHRSAVVEQRKNDSVRIETRIERIIERDTVFFEIPAQIAERTTLDTVSYLENDFASSEVHLHSDGSFTHSLNTKPQLKSVAVDKTVERRDSIIYRNREVEKIVPVPVEKKLTKWQQTSIKYFPYSLGLILLSCVFIFRKRIFSLIRRFI